MHRRAVRRTIAAAMALSLALHAAAASAQTWPAKPVRFVVSLAAGGAVDVMARLVAQNLQQRLGQPFVVENRAGAAGTIAAQLVAKSAPDGYTVLVGANQEITMSPSMTAKAGYDPLRDFTPVLKAVNAPQLVYVSAASGITSMRELLERARANPGRTSYATSSPGSPMHITLEQLREKAGVSWEHVAYKGAAPVMNDLLGGQLAFASSSVASAMGQIRAQKIRPLAVLTAERTSLLPDVPTLREATGLDIPEYPVWYAFTAPAGVPREVIAKLAQELTVALEDADVRGKLVAQGLEVIAIPGERYGPTLPAELALFGDAIRKMKITLD